jgi:hypothetical protein
MDDSRLRGALLNVWSVAGLGRNELRNAAVLAWLLDPNQTHGRGGAVLHALLGRLKETHTAAFPLPNVQGGSWTVFTESYSLHDAENRIDLVLDGENFTAFVEVKIDSIEGHEQISRYVATLGARAQALCKEHFGLIYLTADRSKPRSAESSNIILATWADVASAIEKIVKADKDQRRDFTNRILLSLADHMRTL